MQLDLFDKADVFPIYHVDRLIPAILNQLNHVPFPP